MVATLFMWQENEPGGHSHDPLLVEAPHCSTLSGLILCHLGQFVKTRLIPDPQIRVWWILWVPDVFDKCLTCCVSW